jgi:cyclic pyranopterin phosphate synthase
VYCRDGGCDAANGAPLEPTVEEVRFLAECAASEGVRKVRLTGGEPLLRDDLEEIVAALKKIPGIGEAVLTTNAIGLAERAKALSSAGLSRVNISLDTLRHETFARIAGEDRLDDVLAGIEQATKVFDEVKLNAVLMRGVNDDEIETLVRFAAKIGTEIRFIERYGFRRPGDMPRDGVPVEEVRRRIEAAFGPIRPVQASPLSVADRFEIPSLDHALIGLIASSTHPPCDSCEKLRITSDGELRGCLFAASGVDVRPFLAAKDAASLRRAVRNVFSSKCRAGPGTQPTAAQPINRIGG